VYFAAVDLVVLGVMLQGWNEASLFALPVSLFLSFLSLLLEKFSLFFD